MRESFWRRPGFANPIDADEERSARQVLLAKDLCCCERGGVASIVNRAPPAADTTRQEAATILIRGRSLGLK